VDQSRVSGSGKIHFLALSTQALRRILVEQARPKPREQRRSLDFPLSPRSARGDSVARRSPDQARRPGSPAGADRGMPPVRRQGARRHRRIPGPRAADSPEGWELRPRVAASGTRSAEDLDPSPFLGAPSSRSERWSHFSRFRHYTTVRACLEGASDDTNDHQNAGRRLEPQSFYFASPRRLSPGTRPELVS